MKTPRSPMRHRGAFGSLFALLLVLGASSAAAAPPLLDAAAHPKFVNPLPIPGRMQARAGDHFEMQINETVQWLGLVDQNGDPLLTTVWGYGRVGSPVSYPGPSFEAWENEGITVRWNNALPPYNFPHGPGEHLLPVDPNVHLAHPVQGGIPVVTHLHGGHSESASDGLPEAWFTQGFAETGPDFVKETFVYDNDQPSATLWYHDHALGITRLNVYAGLAGFYLLRDATEENLIRRGVLPSGPYEIEIAIQDRMFTRSGALYYPSDDPDILPGFERLPSGPSVIAEFFGDFILVNGVAWPRLEVEARKYRFRLLNGSDSRFYVLELRNRADDSGPLPFLQIGTDNGLLEKAVRLEKLLLGPGERADVVVNFAGLPLGTEIVLRNFGPDEPFRGFNEDGTLTDGEEGTLPPADPATTGQTLLFSVSEIPVLGPRDFTVAEGTRLARGNLALPPADVTRQLALFEGRDQYGRLQPLLGTLEEGSKGWFEPITEYPLLDDVEVWEIYNATEDAHPIHLHLVSFQILDRRSFEGFVEDKPQLQHDGSLGVGGILHVEEVGDDVRPPAPNERGRKDTAVMLPGEVTRVIARYDRLGQYVWHCHILSHEDHEMMRPYEVVDPAAPVALGTTAGGSGMASLSLTPAGRGYSLSLERQSPVEIRIYNVAGALVRTIAREVWEAGEHSFAWDGRTDAGREAPRGIYFLRVRTPEASVTHKAIRL